MSTPALLRLIALVFAAVSFVVLGDTFGKALTAQGVAPLFVAWSRFALAAVLILPFSGLSRAELPQFLDRRVLLRAALISAGICFILTALKTEPIADVYGAFFIGPLVSFALAYFFLGERPTMLRIVLLFLGFAGVLLVVKPGFGGGIGMLFALCAGTCYGGYLASTRLAAGSFRPRFLLISQLVLGAVFLAPLAASVPFPKLDLGIALMILGSALGSAFGNFLLVIANRQAEATLIAPLVYTQLISATLLGGLVFSDWPDAVARSGLALILVSGLSSAFAVRR